MLKKIISSVFIFTIIIHVIDGKIYLPEVCEGYKHKMGEKEVVQIKCEDKNEKDNIWVRSSPN